jgi:tetratricopeptide (TPR) repeat protein
VQELSGGGMFQCPTCFVYNRLTSTFCSACETLLPKAGSINTNLWMGTANEDELKEAFADNRYNHGMELFHEGRIRDAEALFEEAMEHAKHPDYAFFHGLCRLAQDDPQGALKNFEDVLSQQYAGKYPFWPLPISPTDFKRCLGMLQQNSRVAEEILVCFIKGYADYLERRRKAS